MSDALRPHGLYSPWNSPGQNTGVGGLSLLQRIFPTQGLNPGLPHCRRILYQLSHQGSPRTPRSPQPADLLQWRRLQARPTAPSLCRPLVAGGRHGAGQLAAPPRRPPGTSESGEPGTRSHLQPGRGGLRAQDGGGALRTWGRGLRHALRRRSGHLCGVLGEAARWPEGRWRPPGGGPC